MNQTPNLAGSQVYSRNIFLLCPYLKNIFLNYRGLSIRIEYFSNFYKIIAQVNIIYDICIPLYGDLLNFVLFVKI